MYALEVEKSFKHPSKQREKEKREVGDPAYISEGECKTMFSAKTHICVACVCKGLGKIDKYSDTSSIRTKGIYTVLIYINQWHLDTLSLNIQLENTKKLYIFRVLFSCIYLVITFYTILKQFESNGKHLFNLIICFFPCHRFVCRENKLVYVCKLRHSKAVDKITLFFLFMNDMSTIKRWTKNIVVK